MLGFHPFSTQSFSESAPFVDALTTTNVITSAISSAVIESIIITTTAGEISLTTQTLPNNSIIVAALPTTNILTITQQTPSLFTYNDVSDNVGETWSNVVTTSSSETWNEV